MLRALISSWIPNGLQADKNVKDEEPEQFSKTL